MAQPYGKIIPLSENPSRGASSVYLQWLPQKNSSIENISRSKTFKFFLDFKSIDITLLFVSLIFILIQLINNIYPPAAAFIILILHTQGAMLSQPINTRLRFTF